MSGPIDTLLAKIKALSGAIADLSPDDPERSRLEEQREALRQTAGKLSVQGRHPQSVAREIESIEHRLDEIRALRIKEGYQERRQGKNIQDPGAYSANINKLLAEHHAAEVDTLTDQLERLRPHTESDDSR